MARNKSDDYKTNIFNWLQTYPGAIKMATIRGYTQYLPAGKYTNSSLYMIIRHKYNTSICLNLNITTMHCLFHITI